MEGGKEGAPLPEEDLSLWVEGEPGASMGYLEAWAINPARDFGPRLFCFLAGWGSSALPSPSNYWWIPIVAPLIGAALGGGAYQLFIWPFLPARDRALLEESERAHVKNARP